MWQYPCRQNDEAIYLKKFSPALWTMWVSAITLYLFDCPVWQWYFLTVTNIKYVLYVVILIIKTSILLYIFIRFVIILDLQTHKVFALQVQSSGMQHQIQVIYKLWLWYRWLFHGGVWLLIICCLGFKTTEDLALHSILFFFYEVMLWTDSNFGYTPLLWCRQRFL